MKAIYATELEIKWRFEKIKTLFFETIRVEMETKGFKFRSSQRINVEREGSKDKELSNIHVFRRSSINISKNNPITRVNWLYAGERGEVA
jgi:hypothetical protein